MFDGLFPPLRPELLFCSLLSFSESELSLSEEDSELLPSLDDEDEADNRRLLRDKTGYFNV